MAKFAKNTKQAADVWVGMTIQPNTYYELETSEYAKWANDSKVLADVASGDLIIAKKDNGSKDIVDVAEAINFLKDDLVEVDDDGRQIIRAASTYRGWRYLARPVEFETSKLNSVYTSNWQETDRADYTIKYFDDQGAELTAGTQTELDSSCVKTVITISPTFDYDLIGGHIHQHTTPTANIRMWVVAGAIQLGTAGTKEFVGGLNMKYMGTDEQIETDGRASARMNVATTGIPVPTNEIQLIITHPAGHNHELMVVLEYFRP